MYSTSKKIVILIAGVFIILLYLFGGLGDTNLGAKKTISVDKQLKTDKANIIKEKVYKSKDGEDIVVYRYKGKKAPKKISKEEIENERTETTYTELISENVDGTVTKKLYSYSGQVFFKENNDWYEVEYATTTKDAYDQQTLSPIVYFVKKTFAATFSDYSLAGDGAIETQIDITSCGTGAQCQADWDTLHAASTGTADYTQAFFASYLGYGAGTRWKSTNPDRYYISRSFIPFDTSSIPSGATINNATSTFEIDARSNGENDGTNFVMIVGTTQASSTILSDADFDQVGSTPFSDVEVDITGLSVGNDVSFVHNTAGLAAIITSGGTSACGTDTGVTCIGIREGHDLEDELPNANTAGTYVRFHSAEETGTSADPLLEIEYTVVTAGAVIRQSELFF